MAKVYDKATNAEIDVPASEAQAGISEGRYVARGPVRVAKGFDTGTVDGDQLLGSLANGWRVVDDDEIAKIQQRREASAAGAQILGAGEQALAGASLGLSTLGLNALLGDEYTEDAAARAEALGGIGTAAEVAGGIGAALLPGLGQAGLAARGGLAARAARTAALPTRAATSVGQAAERGAAALGLGRPAALGVRGVVEGGIAGAGAKVHESVLGDRELAAESIMIDGGVIGGLLGGGLGVGGKLAADAAAGVAKVPIGAARRVLGRSFDAPGGEMGDMAAKEVAGSSKPWRQSAADKVGDLAERIAPFSDARPDVAGRVFRNVVNEPQRVTDLLSRRSQIEEAAAATVRDDLGRVRVALDDAQIASQGASKYKRIARDLKGIDDVIAPRMSERVREAIDARVDELMAENAASSHRAYDVAALREAKALVGRTFQQMVDNPKAIGAYEAMDRLRRDLAPLIDSTGGFGGKSRFHVTTDVAATNKELRGFYGKIREHLERDDLWNAGAAVQRELNASWTNASNAMREFSDEASGSGLSRIFRQDGTINMPQALRLVRSYNRAGGAEVANRLDDVLQAQLDHLEVVKRHFDLEPDTARKIADAERGVAELRKTMRQQAKDAGDLADLTELRGAESGSSVSIGIGSNIGTATGAILGSAIAGPIGTVAGMVAGAALRPYTAARTLASLLAMADRVGTLRRGASSGTLSKILGGAGRIKEVGSALGKQAGEAGKRLIKPIVYQSAKDRSDRVERAREQTLMLAANPQVMLDRLRDRLEIADDVAPGMTEAARDVAQRATQFLGEHAPHVYHPPFGKPMISQSEADRYLRYVEAIEQPLETLARLDDGSLTADHVDAIEAVYPKTLNETRQEVIEALSIAEAEGRDVPFDARLRAGVLLRIATDVALDPQVLAAIQASFGDQVQQESNEMAAPANALRAAGAQNMKPEIHQTPSQRVESGAARA